MSPEKRDQCPKKKKIVKILKPTQHAFQGLDFASFVFPRVMKREGFGREGVTASTGEAAGCGEQGPGKAAFDCWGCRGDLGIGI